jgi:hypothetical protein
MRRVLPAKLALSRARPAEFEPATRGLEVRWYIYIPAQWRPAHHFQRVVLPLFIYQPTSGPLGNSVT